MTHEQLVSTLIMLKWVPLPGGFMFPPDSPISTASPHIIITSSTTVVIIMEHYSPARRDNGEVYFKDNSNEEYTNQEALDIIMEYDW